MVMIRYVNGVPGAPEAIGPYSQATVVNGMAYLSGQIPIDPETGAVVEGGVGEQANQVMKNLAAVLSFMHVDFSNVVKTGIFLTDMNDFQTVNEIYAHWLGDVRPARATVAVAGLPKGVRVEIEMIAALEMTDEAMIPHGETDAMSSTHGGGYTVKSES